MNIILQGLNAENRFYSATIADLRAKFRSNPSSITFVSSEELFLNLDDELFTKRRRGEQANYIHGQPQKQDMSKVNSFFVVKWDTISATAPKPNSKAIITTIYLI